MTVSRIRYYLVNIVAFLATLPFVAPIPIGSDVQYPVFMAGTLVVLMDIYYKKFTLLRVELFFLITALLSLVYVYPFADFDYQPFKRVGLLFSFLLFYVFRKYWRVIEPKYILAAIYINCFAAICHYMRPGTFSMLAGNITRTIKISSLSGSRGVSGLAPEPGFLGAMAVYFILVIYIFLKEGRVGKRQFFLVLFLSLLLIGFSKSGTGVFMLFFLAGIYFLSSNISLIYKAVLISFFAVSIWSLIYLSGFSGRGVSIARGLIESPKTVFFQDASVAMRGLAVSIGVTSLLQGHLLGHGVGSFSYVARDLLEKNLFADLYIEVSDKAGGLLSAWAQYTTEMGLFFLVLIIWVYFHTTLKHHRYVIFARGVSVLYLTASFSILFPPLWLLLAGTDRFNTKFVPSD